MTTFSYEHWVRDNSHCRSRTHDGNIYIQRKSSCITNILFLDISTILHIRRDVPQQQTPKKKQNGKLDKSLQILHLNILHSKLSEFYKGQRFFVDAQLDDPEYSVIEGGIK